MEDLICIHAQWHLNHLLCYHHRVCTPNNCFSIQNVLIALRCSVYAVVSELVMPFSNIFFFSKKIFYSLSQGCSFAGCRSVSTGHRSVWERFHVVVFRHPSVSARKHNGRKRFIPLFVSLCCQLHGLMRHCSVPSFLYFNGRGGGGYIFRNVVGVSK